MNQDRSQKLWRFTELPDCSTNNADDILISSNKKLHLPIKNTAKDNYSTEELESVNSATEGNNVKSLSPKLQDKNVILLKNIRLLKVHVYKPKITQSVPNESDSLLNSLCKEVEPPIVQISTERILTKPEPTTSCQQSKVDKLLITKSNIESCVIGPSEHWTSQPKRYRGAKKIVQMPLLCADTTDGETSGMGSSVDDVFESSTESEATASFPPPKTSNCRSLPPPSAKKRRGGWPKGRKRNPNTALTKNSYPKSPTTAYGYFLIERHKLYQNIEPNIPIAFLSKILGAEWKHLSEEDRAVFLGRSERDKQRYRNEVKCYRLSRENQLVLRKKRAKPSSMKEKKSMGEESSDCTDEVDDEESGDLYCKTCDQWFTSLHNKSEHIYGRYHLQALREGQPKTWKSRWKPTSSKSVTFASNEESKVKTNPINGKSESEDDISMSTGDEQASKSDCQSYRESTTEDEDEIHCQPSYPERVSDYLQAVVFKVYDREQEIHWLTEHLKKAQRHQELLLSSLSSLEKRHKELEKEHGMFTATERILIRELQSVLKLPLAVVDSKEPNSLSTVRLLEEVNNKRYTGTVITNSSKADPEMVNSITDNSSQFNSSDIDNIVLENALDLETFSSSIFGDVDLNLFANDIFLDVEQHL